MSTTATERTEAPARRRERGRRGCFRLLQERMAAHGVTPTDLGRRLRLSVQSVRRRLNAVCEWTLSEMYAVMDMLDIPESEMYLYWPRNYVSSEKCADRNVRQYLVETNQSLVSDSSLDALIALVDGMEKARVPHGRAPRAV